MNKELMDNVVTPEEYFTILAQERDLTPKEEMQKRIFEEEFLTNSENYSYHLSQATDDVYGQYQKGMAAMALKENKTSLETEALENYQRKVLEMENKNENEMVRKLSNDKGGYVNATIILVMILNIGFIIAMALLGSK